jgi:DNA-binding beta-propeller fold protein YncE
MTPSPSVPSSEFQSSLRNIVRRGAKCLAFGVATMVVLQLMVARPVLANRPYDSQITGFNSPRSVALDSAGDVWITDRGNSIPSSNVGKNGIYEFNPYPSQALLLVPSTFEAFGPFSEQALDAVVDDDTHELLVMGWNPRNLYVFSTTTGEYLRKWTSIGKNNACSNCAYVAIDNSHTYSRSEERRVGKEC